MSAFAILSNTGVVTITAAAGGIIVISGIFLCMEIWRVENCCTVFVVVYFAACHMSEHRRVIVLS